MKFKNSNIVLTISVSLCLILGLAWGFSTNFNTNPTKIVIDGRTEEDSSSDQPIIVGPSDDLVIARDINLYSHESAAIIVGEVKNVGEPYLRQDRGLTSQQDIIISVSDVLKGDSTAKEYKVLIEGGQPVSVLNGEGTVMMTEKSPLFQVGEKVLLFLGKTNFGDYVVFADGYGKYLIDANDNTTSEGDFSMPLSELEAKIKAALAS